MTGRKAKQKETAVTSPSDRPSAPESRKAGALSHPLRSGALSSRKPTRFDLRPDADQRTAMAAELGLLALHAFRFAGEVVPVGRQDFTLRARLEARLDQACIVTLAPVPAQIEEEVERRYLHDYVLPEAEEVEMPEDDSLEPLPEVIDVGAVAMEALALALPLYPRSPGAALGEATFPPPDAEPLADEAVKPFASLAALRDKLAKKDD